MCKRPRETLRSRLVFRRGVGAHEAVRDRGTGDTVGWITVARDRAAVDRVDPRLIAAARAAMPPGLPDDGTILLPLEPTTDRCRLCGETRSLTKEHIPPAAAFNRATATERDPWDREVSANDELPEGRTWSGGIWGYTLCADCNSRTGGWYGTEYQQWAIAAVNSMAEAGLNVKTLDAQRGPLRGRFGLGGDPGPRPGAFVRQALSMMASISGPWDLAGRWPAIRRIVLDRTQESLPHGMSMGLTYFLGPYSRIVGPALEVRTDLQSWRWVMEVAHAPLAILFVLASSHSQDHVFSLGGFTTERWRHRSPVEGDMEIGFGHVPYPGDYRTQADLTAG